jgi:hypothetical protein
MTTLPFPSITLRRSPLQAPVGAPPPTPASKVTPPPAPVLAADVDPAAPEDAIAPPDPEADDPTRWDAEPHVEALVAVTRRASSKGQGEARREVLTMGLLLGGGSALRRDAERRVIGTREGPPETIGSRATTSSVDFFRGASPVTRRLSVIAKFEGGQITKIALSSRSPALTPEPDQGWHTVLVQLLLQHCAALTHV